MHSSGQVAGLARPARGETGSATFALVGTADATNLASMMRDATLVLEPEVFLLPDPSLPFAGSSPSRFIEGVDRMESPSPTRKGILALRGSVPAERPAMSFAAIRKQTEAERAERNADTYRGR